MKLGHGASGGPGFALAAAVAEGWRGRFALCAVLSDCSGVVTGGEDITGLA